MPAMNNPELTMNTPDLAPVLDLIEAFRRSKTMFAAVKLGIFDHLDQNPSSAEQIARRLGAQPDSCERLLDALVSLRLVRREGDLFANEPVSDRLLRRASPHTLTRYILYSNDVLYRMWEHLEEAVLEGSNRWEQTFGQPSATLFDHFFSTDEKLETFIQGMHGFGVISSPAVVRAFDLSAFQHLADLGGATGHLAIAACEQYPRLRATVFDLPRVIPVAEKHVSQSSARDRIACVSGDFFNDPLPPADLYTLGRILHDWSEEKIDRLLARIFEALPSRGALLIAERLMDDDLGGPLGAHMQSLNMLICTEGRERSVEQYRKILERAGFTRVEGVRTGLAVDAVLASKMG